MTRIFLSLSFITILLAGCARKENQHGEAKSLYNEAMKIHDEVMPRMDEMFTLRQKLTLKLDSLKGDSVVHATKIEQIRKAILELASADEDMMDWMHNIKDVSGDEGHAHHGSHDNATPKLTPEEMLKTQKQQKEVIEKTRSDIEASITKAKELLNTN